MLLEPKEDITYGPVQSRRLGSSLGINLFPGIRKQCSFDCIYCQYGFEKPISRQTALRGLPSIDEVMHAIVSHLKKLNTPPSYLTFSGNGEATLHPHFTGMVKALNELKNSHIPEARTAILSNSSSVDIPEIRGALELLDVRIMKLDAGTDDVFRRYNRPSLDVDFLSIVEGLARLDDVTIQTLMTGGPLGNNSIQHVAAWIDCLDSIRPEMIQLYSLDRTSPSANITKLSVNELEKIANRVRSRGHEVGVYSRSERVKE